VKVEAEVKVTPRLVAEMIAGLNDEQQAQVIIELAAIAEAWTGDGSDLFTGWTYQFFLVGRHLAKCACSTDAARELVHNLHIGMVG